MGSLIIKPPWGHGAVSGIDTNVYGAYASKCWEGHWIPEKHKWEYFCRICGVGESRLKSAYPIEGWGCFCHDLKLTESYNKENFYLTFDPGDPERMGCVPHSGPEEDYSTVRKALMALAGLAIGLVSIYGAFAWTALTFIIDLVSAIDTEELRSEYLQCEWLYPKEEGGYQPKWPTDCGFWYWWIVWVNPNQTIKFDGHEFFGGIERAWDMYFVEHSFTATIEAGPPPDEMSAVLLRMKCPRLR